MGTQSEIGRLVSVAIREVWADEARDFTPWLAENLDALSTALGMDLALEGTEVRVGPFNADLVLQNTDTNHRVVVENLLGATDHDHLGKMLTYAAGLEATHAVLVAERFRGRTPLGNPLAERAQRRVGRILRHRAQGLENRRLARGPPAQRRRKAGPVGQGNPRGKRAHEPRARLPRLLECIPTGLPRGAPRVEPCRHTIEEAQDEIPRGQGRHVVPRRLLPRRRALAVPGRTAHQGTGTGALRRAAKQARRHRSSPRRDGAVGAHGEKRGEPASPSTSPRTRASGNARCGASSAPGGSSVWARSGRRYSPTSTRWRSEVDRRLRQNRIRHEGGAKTMNATD